jgi:hypothetical protein
LARAHAYLAGAAQLDGAALGALGVVDADDALHVGIGLLPSPHGVIGGCEEHFGVRGMCSRRNTEMSGT